MRVNELEKIIEDAACANGECDMPNCPHGDTCDSYRIAKESQKQTLLLVKKEQYEECKRLGYSETEVKLFLDFVWKKYLKE